MTMATIDDDGGDDGGSSGDGGIRNSQRIHFIGARRIATKEVSTNSQDASTRLQSARVLR
tara:strand:- start:328 stop:507 length:180 start_codon:yes stop_codon:yes gene_type:complete